MARLPPPRIATSSSSSSVARQQKNASIFSMERALRTLTPSSSPTFPQTPRPNVGGSGQNHGARKQPLKPVPQTPRTNNGHGGPSSTRKKSFKSSSSETRGGGGGGGGGRRTPSDDDDGEESVKVAIRMRPLAPSTSGGGGGDAGRAWRASSERNSIVEIPTARNGHGQQDHPAPPRTPRTPGGRRGSSGESSGYIYDRVFGEDTNTCEIYDELVGDIVESVTKEGVNGTVFTYGQTSSGKTFTMQGCRPDDSIGIIQYAANDVFRIIKEEKSDGSDSECSVRVSYVEIYNEELRDLLSDGGHKSPTSLVIREDKRGSISVEGLREVPVNSLDELMDAFRAGEANKSVGSTKMNDRSSRSHAILKIIVERETVLNVGDDAVDEDKENLAGSSEASSSDLVVKTSSALNLVDLAGSESVRHTGASGMQKKEGGMINQSLLTLSKVLMSLGQKNPGHINYRDSKLTRILKPSLSGNARMAVICCISPSDMYVEETRSTLQFATRAKLVKTNAMANEVVEDTDLISRLRLENAKVKWENRKLEDRLRNMGTANDSDGVASARRLDNLKKFVFAERPKVVSRPTARARRLSAGSVSFADERRNPRNVKESGLACQPTSKDDLHVLLARDEMNSFNDGEILRAALEFKAKQVESLQARLSSSGYGTETKAARDKRYSSISETRSPDVDRRYSMINELRSPDADRRASVIGREQYPDGDRIVSIINETRSPMEDRSPCQVKSLGHGTHNFQTENEQLESKLAEANSVIVDLELQIDELTSQKNDALDWIEELYAKSDQKDEKIMQVCEARNDATKRCEALDNELRNHKELLRNVSTDLEQSASQNEKLRKDTKEVKAEIMQLESERGELLNAAQPHADASNNNDDVSELREANEVLKSQVQELEDFSSKYVEEKRALIEQIEKYEEELTQADVLLKSIGDELDDATFSLEEEKRKWLKEKEELIKKMSGDADGLSPRNTEKVESLELERDALQLTLNIKVCELQNDLNAANDDKNHALQQLELEREKSNADHESFKLQEETLGAEIKKGLETIESLQNKVTVADEELKKKSRENGTSAASFNDKVLELKREIDAVKKENETLAKKVKSISGDLDAKQTQLEILDRDKGEALKKLELMQEKCNSDLELFKLKEEILRSEILKGEETLKSLQGTGKEVDIKKITEGHDKDMAALNTKITNLQKRLDNATVENESLIKKLKDSSAELETKAIQLESLEHHKNEALKQLGQSQERYNSEIAKGEEKVKSIRAEARQQLVAAKTSEASRANHEVRGLKAENERLRAERRHLTKNFDDCCHKVDELSNELSRVQRQVKEAEEQEEKAKNRLARIEQEKLVLAKENSAADAKVKELFARVQNAKKELNVLQKANASLKGRDQELRGSVSRIQQLVEALSSENADLKEKNESFGRRADYLENRSRELQCLLSTATSERDIAYSDRDNLMKSNVDLLSKSKMLSNERDAALREKEISRVKLDKIAASFEADYETVRAKIDTLLVENKDLQGKITFLEASKASVENNADRILERDNALAGQHDRLKSSFKKQSMKVTELQGEVNQLVQRLANLKEENRRLSRDNSALKDMCVQEPETRFDEPNYKDEHNSKKRAVFGFRK